MNSRIITENHAADSEKGPLTKLISDPYGRERREGPLRGKAIGRVRVKNQIKNVGWKFQLECDVKIKNNLRDSNQLPIIRKITSIITFISFYQTNLMMRKSVEFVKFEKVSLIKDGQFHLAPKRKEHMSNGLFLK